MHKIWQDINILEVAIMQDNGGLDDPISMAKIAIIEEVSVSKQICLILSAGQTSRTLLVKIKSADWVTKEYIVSASTRTSSLWPSVKII